MRVLTHQSWPCFTLILIKWDSKGQTCVKECDSLLSGLVQAWPFHMSLHWLAPSAEQPRIPEMNITVGPQGNHTKICPQAAAKLTGSPGTPASVEKMNNNPFVLHLAEVWALGCPVITPGLISGRLMWISNHNLYSIKNTKRRKKKTEPTQPTNNETLNKRLRIFSFFSS